MSKTTISVVLSIQTKQDKWTSNFMKNCDFWDIWIFRKMNMSFNTTTKVDEEYIEKLKSSLVWKECDEFTIHSVEDISIKFN